MTQEGTATDPYLRGGNWTMISSNQGTGNVSTPSNQDLYLQRQQYHLQFQPEQLLLQQTPHRQPLASHFHLVHLVEKAADAIDSGTRDQHSDSLINELNNQFEKCQQLLNSISASISTKAMTVEAQKKKLEYNEQLLIQRRDLIANQRSSMEAYIRSET